MSPPSRIDFSAFDALPAFVVVLDPDGRVVHQNAAFSQLSGVPLEAALGRPVFEFFELPAGTSVPLRIFRDVKAADFPNQYESVGRNASGERIRVLWRNSASFDEQGGVRFVFGTGFELSGSADRVAALEESERRFGALERNSHDLIVEVDSGGRVLYASPNSETILGRPPKDLLGESVFEGLHPDDRRSAAMAARRLGRQGSLLERAFRHRRGDGSWRWLETSAATFQAADGSLRAVLSSRDVTELREAESRQSDLGRILEQSLNEIYVFDARTLRFMNVNEGARRNLGYSMQELRGLTPVDLKPDFDADSFAALIETLHTGAQSELSFETLHRRKDGSLYPVEVHLQLESYEGAPAFVALIWDTTERQRSEQALRDSQAQLSGIIASAMDALVTIDREHRIVLFNDAAERMFRCKREEVLGETLDRFIPEALREKHPEFVRRFADSGITTRRMGRLGEVEGLRADAEVFPIEASISHLETGGEAFFTAILRDVTERKLAEEELRETERRARDAERLASISTLTAGIAHDIGTPMNVILGYAEMLSTSLSDPRDRERADMIAQQVRRVTELVRTLLDFARPRESERGPVDLAALVAECSSFLREKLRRRGIRVEQRSDAIPPVQGDRDRLQQVFLNLFLNAADAMPDGGRLLVEVSPHGVDEVGVRVTDEGAGIAPDDLEQIFEPFFTTKTRGKGTGLGLVVTRGIVVDHGGRIEVESEPGRGSCFSVLLPLHGGEESAEGGPPERLPS